MLITPEWKKLAPDEFLSLTSWVLFGVSIAMFVYESIVIAAEIFQRRQSDEQPKN